MTYVRRRNSDARKLSEQACGDSRFGYDVAGTRYSKDVGDDVARVQGITFIGPDHQPFEAGCYHSDMPTKTRDWRNMGPVPGVTVRS